MWSVRRREVQRVSDIRVLGDNVVFVMTCLACFYEPVFVFGDEESGTLI